MFVDMRIVDGEGRVLPHDGAAQGELQCRGLHVVREYFRVRAHAPHALLVSLETLHEALQKEAARAMRRYFRVRHTCTAVFHGNPEGALHGAAHVVREYFRVRAHAPHAALLSLGALHDALHEAAHAAAQSSAQVLVGTARAAAPHPTLLEHSSAFGCAQHEGSHNVSADGWFGTGDVANIDVHGHVQLTDRAKDVIKSGGEWISSIDLENVAVAHPQVPRHPRHSSRAWRATPCGKHLP